MCMSSRSLLKRRIPKPPPRAQRVEPGEPDDTTQQGNCCPGEKVCDDVNAFESTFTLQLTSLWLWAVHEGAKRADSRSSGSICFSPSRLKDIRLCVELPSYEYNVPS